MLSGWFSGSKLGGKYITKKTDCDDASEDGPQGRKGVSKFAPFVDSSIAGGISDTVMKLMGNRHISNSYQIALAKLKKNRELVVAVDDTGNTR